MEKLTFQELKKVAKNHIPKIKKYYTMTKAELLIRLQLKDVPIELLNEKKTLEDLQKEAKLKEIPRVWSYRRDELIKLLYPIE